MTNLENANRRILVIDDNPAIHDDFRKVLLGAQTQAPELDAAEQALFGAPVVAHEALPFELDSAFQGQEGLERVRDSLSRKRPYALAFVDVRMPPGWDGIETISRIWQEYPELEVVVCTAYSDYDWRAMMDRLRRSDKLLILKKPFDNIEVQQMAWALTTKWNLAQEAQHAMKRLDEQVQVRTSELRAVNENLVAEVAERMRIEQLLKHFAFHDPLTDLPNRALFLDRLKHAAKQKLRRTDFNFAVLYLDLDGFKEVNDSLGHQAGDTLLIEVARRLAKCLRPADTLARMGGDEFTVILEDIQGSRDAELCAERLRNALNLPFELCGVTKTISASIGISLSVDKATNADDLLRDADRSMYCKKALRKNGLGASLPLRN